MALEILATLWPEMGHFHYFARDNRLGGIRLNTAMTNTKELPGIVRKAVNQSGDMPLYFDVKGRQLRITEVSPNNDHLECRINHPISVDTPTMVLFKAGVDGAVLQEVRGDYLVFDGGPKYGLIPGESLHVRDSSLKVHGPTFTPEQLAYLDIAMSAGIRRYMLSYVTSSSEIRDMRKIVGDSEIVAKIESLDGLKYVDHEYRKSQNLGLLTARGDLFVEVHRPHEIADATKRIIRADRDAIVGSRILLSLGEDEVPSCADISEVNWLLDVGYRRFMFCDSLCLKKDALDHAVNVLQAIYDDYQPQTYAPKGFFGRLMGTVRHPVV